MNKFMTTALGFCCAAAMASTAAVAGECSTANIKGHYTYWLQGADSSGKAFAEVGQEHYDGAGNVVSKIGVAGTEKLADDKGTYAVNDDCSGTVTYASGTSYNIFISPNGDSFVFSSSKGGAIQAGENTRVDKD